VQLGPKGNFTAFDPRNRPFSPKADFCSLRASPRSARCSPRGRVIEVGGFPGMQGGAPSHPHPARRGDEREVHLEAQVASYDEIIKKSLQAARLRALS
jgi:hypothetical protein